MKEKLLPTDTKIKVSQDAKPTVSSHLCLEKDPHSTSDCFRDILCKFWGFIFTLKLLLKIQQKITKQFSLQVFVKAIRF